MAIDVLTTQGQGVQRTGEAVRPTASPGPAFFPELEQQAHRVREHIVRMSTGGGCFIGSALSCTDLVVYLYNHFLKISRETLEDPSRDYLFLSKGHAVPALYGMFIELGWLDPDRLHHYLKPTDYLYWHPNRHIPGIEFPSGSLGHLLATAAGVALEIKIRGHTNRVAVILGDGELNEGSNWEALLVASAYHLDNLVVIIDRNRFQANLRTEELIPLESLEEKFTAFGCQVRRGDGHSFSWLHRTFTGIPFMSDRVNVVVADTLRGKGIPAIQERADRWFGNFSPAEIDDLLTQLKDR
jgi:transketolase